MSAAQRMMEKMGWKVGMGLGREEQGMKTPLMAKKTDSRSGVIVNAPDLVGASATPPPMAAAAADGAPAEKRQKLSREEMGEPSCVVLMRNMVGPGEVDDELEDEVAGECEKYGDVLRVLIFEVTTPGFPAEETVRIFVQFDTIEAATKALEDLAGRFFGGRVVRASFFDEARLDRNELAPRPEEVVL